MKASPYSVELDIQEQEQPLDPETRNQRNTMLEEGAKDAVFEAADMIKLWVYLDILRSRDYVVNFSDASHYQEFEKNARLRQRAFSGDDGSAKKDLETIDGDIEQYLMDRGIKIDQAEISKKMRNLLYAEGSESPETSDVITYVRRGVYETLTPKVSLQRQAEADTETDQDFERLYAWLCDEMNQSHLEGEAMASLRFKLEALEEAGVHIDLQENATFQRVARIIEKRKKERNGMNGTAIDVHIRALTWALQDVTLGLDVSQREIDESISNMLLNAEEF